MNRKVVAVVLAHAPTETWDCSACGALWPCEPARGELRELHADDPVELAVHMAHCLGRAAGVLAAEDPHHLYQRFISWTQPPALDSDHAAALR
ncbi:hypothetical protein K1W54_28840 [Micromonospora sp. CPCC 205371]|nr:hypothetical protein [Micromonospora sp. CPCC 205371]